MSHTDPYAPVFDTTPYLIVHRKKGGFLVLSCSEKDYLPEVCQIAAQMATQRMGPLFVAFEKGTAKVFAGDQACDILASIQKKIERRELKALRAALRSIHPTNPAFQALAPCTTGACHELDEVPPPRKSPGAAHGGAVRSAPGVAPEPSV